MFVIVLRKKKLLNVFKYFLNLMRPKKLKFHTILKICNLVILSLTKYILHENAIVLELHS